MRVLSVCLVALAVIALVDAQQCYKDGDLKVKRGECGETTMKLNVCASSQDEADLYTALVKGLAPLAEGSPTTAECVSEYESLCGGADKTKATTCDVWCDNGAGAEPSCENDDQCAASYVQPKTCCSVYESRWGGACTWTAEEIASAVNETRTSGLCADTDCYSAGSHMEASLLLVSFLALFATRFY